MREHVDIVVASLESIGVIQDLWREYWDFLGLPSDFQNFEEERKSLPGVYGPPKGRLLLASIQGNPVGTAALRPLREGSCEAKRLYVRPEYRGRGVAGALLVRLIDEARAAGYEEMYGDTLQSMKSALRLYRQIGFSEVPPYTSHPTPGAIFLKLSL
jgi:GNAT superfamily N-acetyltransferase